jgi:Mn2+/Fe2+ NRAMP family transporter
MKPTSPGQPKRRLWIGLFIPGILVAATGVGAGDLITAGLAGSEIGLALLWAAAAGSLLKWTLNEGLARWQMATGTTLLEGWSRHLGGWVRWLFLFYFLIWSYSVGGALINACGVAGAGLFPLGNPHTSKIIWGIFHSLLGLLLVRIGGFRIFQYIMSGVVVIMVGTVLLTVFRLQPDWPAVARGLFIPSLPPGGTAWLVGVIGGVGGTVTLLSYSYWIHDKGRRGLEGVRSCRLDLGAGYLLTALFGISMIFIGSRVEIGGSGAGVALTLAGELERALGPVGRWIFLVGFWGAVFSSLLGVWQSVPSIFSDFFRLQKKDTSTGNPTTIPDLTRTKAYRWYLAAIAIVPLHLLWFSLKQVQLVYAVLGAIFMPFLAVTLLILNNRIQLVGRPFRNSLAINILLIMTLVFFSFIGVRELWMLLLR